MAETRTRAPAGPAGPGGTVTASSQRRFARRQWSRRWLRLRYVVVAVLGLALLVVGVWAIWFSSLLAVEQVEVAGADVLERAGGPRGRLGAGGRPGRPHRPRRGPCAGRGAGRGAQRRRDPRLARRRPRRASRSGWPSRSCASARRCAGWTPRAWSSATTRRPPADLPRVDALSGVTSEALREGAAVVAALPEDLAADVDHVEVGTVDQIRLRAARRARGGVGERLGLRAEGSASSRSCCEQDGRVFDVSVPATPTTRS